MDIKGKMFEIVSGPCKGDLIDALRYAYDKGANASIDFDVVEGLTSRNKEVAAYLKMDAKNWRVTSISYEDASGNNFNIAGYVTVKNEIGNDCTASYVAYYNTNSRTGHIKFK